MSEVQTEHEADVELEAPDGEPSPAEQDLPEQPEQGDPDADEAADDDENQNDDGSGADPSQGDEQARQQAAMTEQALEKLHTQIGNANKAHAAKIARIMGDDAQALIPCPVCTDFVAGAIFPPEVAPIPPVVQDRMKELLGFNAWEDTPHADWAQQCPDCKGHGEVKTGSFVLGKETTRCLNCGGDGWKNTRDPAQNVLPLAIANGETGPNVYGKEVANDPDVQHLREKGYTVIPPMNVQTG